MRLRTRKTIRNRGQAVADFDEEEYLRQHPDVRTAIKAGLFRSGEDHFQRVGKAEGRAVPAGAEVANRAETPSDHGLDGHQQMTIDRLTVSSRGFVFVAGWVDDRSTALAGLSLIQQGNLIHKPGLKLFRAPRADVAEHLDADKEYGFGVWSVFRVSKTLGPAEIRVAVQTEVGKYIHPLAAERVTETEFRDLILGFVSVLNQQRGWPISDKDEFDAITDIVYDISEKIKNGSKSPLQVIEYNQVEQPDLSVIVVLYGNCSMLYPQARLLNSPLRAVNAELIVVNNSPELWEEARHEIRRISVTLGLPVSLIQPSGNLGFSGGNNLGVEHARGKSILLMNPDVFPRRPDDLVRFAAALNQKKNRRTIMGARLLYDDGSIMHDGMELFFDPFPPNSGSMNTRVVDEMLRVEHIGKGDPLMPADRKSAEIVEVPAITGALIGMSRIAFEELCGFDEKYLFGHYEDVDLCARATRAGYKIAINRSVCFYHLEGKASDFGSPHIKGAIALNRIRCTQLCMSKQTQQTNGSN